jgi:FixJ family two-component response regulator
MVFILNATPGTRDELCALMRSAQWNPIAFGTAAEYLAFPKPDIPACVILDVDLPDMCGLELQRQIAATDAPVVFLTGRSEVAASVRALKSGALDFKTLPCDAVELLEAVEAAIAYDQSTRRQRALEFELRQRYANLTARERQVMRLVAGGLRNKQSAWELRISEFTLQIHRAQVMQKMRARSIVELVRMAAALQIPLYDQTEHGQYHKGSAQGSISPLRMAIMAASVRSATPSFEKILRI